MSIQSLFSRRVLAVSVLAGAACLLGTDAGAVRAAGARSPGAIALEDARILFEYNASANDLGVQVHLDGEDWKRMRIVGPDQHKIFDVRGQGPLKNLGITELFFEGAEPPLSEFPLADLLALFPEGDYQFAGQTIDGTDLVGTAALTHAVPAGPLVSTTVGPGNLLVIGWTPVPGPAAGFPNEPIVIVGYQVIVAESFQVTVPGSATSVTVSPEYVASLGPGTHPFEVLAIEAGGNQTITEGSFDL